MDQDLSAGVIANPHNYISLVKKKKRKAMPGIMSVSFTALSACPEFLSPERLGELP